MPDTNPFARLTGLLALLTAMSLLAGEPDLLLTTQPGASVKATASGYYFAGQELPTDKTLAPTTGWYPLPLPDDAGRLLADGLLTWESAIKTHFRGNQPKQLVIAVDLGRPCRIARIEAWAVGGQQQGNEIQQVAVDYGLRLSAGEPWDGHCQAANPKEPDASAETPYAIALTDFALPARYIRVICESRAPMMVLGELKVFGRPIATPPTDAIPPETLRFEAECIEGAVSMKNDSLLDNHGIYIHDNRLLVDLPDTPPRYTWIRYFDNGQRTMDVTLAGQTVSLPSSPGWLWQRLPGMVAGETELRLLRTGKHAPLVDALLFTPEAAFDPTEITQMDAFMQLPVVLPVAGPAKRLWQDRGEALGPVAWAQAVRELYGYPPAAPRAPVVDAFGNLLIDGQPRFLLSFYHVGPADPRLAGVPVNAAMSGSPDWADFARHDLDCILSYHSQWRAYDVIADLLKDNADHPRLALHYICDEPENVHVSVAELTRLNALVQTLSPRQPTFINVSPNMAGNRGVLGIPDVVGLDQYPIPGGRLADIGFNLDLARLSSGGKPVIFVVQTFSWAAYDRPSGRYPTAEEVRVMAMLALVHQARGLWFYEFPAPKMSSPTYLGDIQPELWADLMLLLEEVQALIPVLTGPETILPFTVTSVSGKPVELRLAISADRQQAVLLAAHPWPEGSAVQLDFSNGPLAEATFTPRFAAAGTDLRQTAPGQARLTLPAHGSATFDVDGAALDQIVFLTGDAAIAALTEKLSTSTDRPIAKVPAMAGSQPPDEATWQQALDLLDTWRSTNRPDAAQAIARDNGLHLRIITRFPKDKKATHLTRDSAVWADPCIELFLGNPATRRYAQLVVNIANVQLDQAVIPEAAAGQDLTVDYSWSSQVTAGSELADYRLVIPWEELRRMTGTEPGAPILFNLASGTSRWDWAGLTGGGYHLPWKFGLLHLPQVNAAAAP